MNALAEERRQRSYVVSPSARVGGELQVPGDKSISHRALLLGAIAEGVTDISGFLESEDCLATLEALRRLGVRIERPEGTRVRVRGVGLRGLRAPDGSLDMGNAGTAMRLFMGLLAGQSFDATLVGDASLMRRPMERAAKPLRLMGADISTHEGRPPVQIRGGRPLTGIRYELPVASAQVKSAVLLAGLYATGRTSVVEPAVSRDHTERMLGRFSVEIERRNGTISLAGGQTLRAAQIQVPGDFSSAAFFLVAGCLAARQGLRLRSVGINPTRAALLDLLRQMGADIRITRTGNEGDAANEPVADIEVHASALRGITVPASAVPIAIDEFPAFFIAAACAEGESLLRGAEELRVKESDRLEAMAHGLAVLGVDHELLPDGIRIRGQSTPFNGGTIDSRGDHRIAMAFAIASLRAAAPLTILDVANVATSFPSFVELATRAGLAIAESES